MSVRRAATVLALAAVGASVSAGAVWAWRHRPIPPRAPAYQVELLDETGDLAIGCLASLWRVEEDENGRALRRLYPWSTRTCASGLSWEGLEPGRYRLMALSHGSAMVDRTFDIEVGEVEDGGTIALEPGGSIRGWVRDGGAPVSGALVAVGGVDREPVQTGSKGHFVIRGLPIGSYGLRAIARDPMRAAEGTADVVQGVKATVELELDPVPMRGVLGIKVAAGAGGARIIDVLAGSAASDCGLSTGDLLVDLDGESLAGRTDEEIRAELGGNPGTSIRLVRVRYGERGEAVCTLR